MELVVHLALAVITIGLVSRVGHLLYLAYIFLARMYIFAFQTRVGKEGLQIFFMNWPIAVLGTMEMEMESLMTQIHSRGQGSSRVLKNPRDRDFSRNFITAALVVINKISVLQSLCASVFCGLTQKSTFSAPW